MKKVLVYIVLLFFSVASAQKITVLNKVTLQPVNNALVFNIEQTKQELTDERGVLDITVFDADEYIIFTHVSYKDFKILKRDITNEIVYLDIKPEKLTEVFLSASKGQESLKRIAEQVEVLPLEKIKEIAPQTAADLLAEIPGIKIQKSQFGGGSPVLRGMEANRVLLVVDGVRMNNAIYRKGHLQNSITVSPNILERTEVIFGPSSVIYGSDALGGVIHYYTKKPKTSDEFNVKTSLMTRYSSANKEKTGQLGLELQFKKFASYSNVSYSTFDDLIMGKNRTHGFSNWGLITEFSNNNDDFYNENPVENTNKNLQRNTGYNQIDVLQKFYIPLSLKTDLTFNFQYGQSSNIPRFDRLTERKNDKLRFAEWFYGPQKRFLASSQLSLKPNYKFLQKGTVTVAYQNIEESRINRKFGSLHRTSRFEEVDVFSFNGDFHVPITPDNKRILSYGTELTYNKVNSNPKGEILTVNGSNITGIIDNYSVQSRYADGGSSYLSSALYINYRQDISKTSTLNSGIRYTNTHLKATWVDETFISLPSNHISLNRSAFTATVGYIYKPVTDWRLNAVLSSGFRSPNIDDVGKVREKGGDVTVPNINLRPEFVYNAELGTVKYFNNKRSAISLTGYYTLLANYIAREKFTLNGNSQILFDGELANIFANVNKGNAYVIGSTLNAQTTLGSYFNANGSLTYTKGKAYDTGEPLSSIPPLFGNIGLNFEKKRFQAGASIRFNARKKASNYNISEGVDNIEQTPVINENAIDDIYKYHGSPSWMTINANTKFSVSKSIDLRAAVHNILDEHYKEFASGVSAAGRNFSFSLLANF